MRYLAALQLGMLLCLHPWHAEAITLETVMRIASEQHPQLQIAEKNIDRARGILVEEGAYAHNPELSVEPQRRRLNAGGVARDYYITLSQGIEVAGKRGYRERSAQAGLKSAQLEAEAERQRVVIEAARAFVELFFAKRTLDLRARQSLILRQMARAIEQKLEAGEANQLDANLSRSAYVNALRAATVAKQAFTLAQARYYTAIGQVGKGQDVKPKLPRLRVDWQPPADAWSVAVASRPDLAALRARLAQAEAQSLLAKAQRMPDPTLSLMKGREAGDRLLLLGVNVPIPVWNSHKGAYKAALAEAERMREEEAWRQQQLKLELQAALYNHANAMAAVASAYQAEAHRSAKDNIELAQAAFNAGELDMEDLLIHINQALEARLTAYEIMRQGWMARIRLAEVLGRPELILEGASP